MASKVILEIDFQGSNAIKTAAELTKTIEKLRVEQKVLDDNLKAGNVSIKDAEIQHALLNAELKESQREYRTVTKFIDDATRATKAQEGSIEANRAKLSQLTAEYIKAANPTKEQAKAVKDLSDKLKQQEGAIGDTRRNVGNYADALKGIGGPIGNAVSGIQGFNTVLKGNPIILVVSLLQNLFQVLGKNAKIADTISFAFGALNKGFHFIVDTIVTTVSSFDNLTNAIKHPIDFLTKLVGGTVDAGKAGYNAAKQMDDFTESQARLNSQIKLNEIQVRSLTAQLKDRTQSEQDRIKIANQIANLEVDSANKQLEKSKELLAAKKLELKDQELKGEEKAQLLELESAVVEAESEKQIAQSQKQTRINILLQKEENSETARLLKEKAEEARKHREEIGNIVLLAENELRAAQLKQKEENDKADKEAKEAANQAAIEEVDKFIKDEETRLKQRADIIKAYNEAEVQLAQAKFDALQGFSEALSNVVGENANAQAALLIFSKLVAIAEIISSLQVEKAKNAAANAVLGVAGAGITLVQNQAANIRAAVGIGVIASQTIPTIQKLEEGGKVLAINGKPHSAGGEDVYVGGQRVANIEGGENMYILKKSASQYINGLSGLNQAFGGASFGTRSNYLADGGSVAIGDGGFSGRVNSQEVNLALQAKGIVNALKEMPAPILRVTDLNRVQAGLKDTVNVSDL